MEIVGHKEFGHDGTVCCVSEQTLLYSLEAEKDSRDRHETCPLDVMEQILGRFGTTPTLICSDSIDFEPNVQDHLEWQALNYLGTSLADLKTATVEVAGRHVEWMSVPHELCHLACSFALSGLDDGQEFYALCWEGWIGKLYHVDADFRVTCFSDGNFMSAPGIRYTFPFHTTGRARIVSHSAAGKMMALAGLIAGGSIRPTPDEQELLSLLLDSEYRHEWNPRGTVDAEGRLYYHAYKQQTGYLNDDGDALYAALAFLNGKPIDGPEFARVSRLLQDGIFERFARLAERHVTRPLPLLISGGCGLNCEWNSRWRDSGLFSSVFVPPVTNDSGIAIGAAAIGQFSKTGSMKLGWSVYAGEEFVHDVRPNPSEFSWEKLNPLRLAQRMLEYQWVVAWVHGRYEIGPRALCHRSLLADPRSEQMRDRLNRIKKREHYRPIAPVCREEEVSEHFEWQGPSPHMLYFQRVLSDRLRAVTHFDGSARVQTVSAVQEPATHQLLSQFRELTGAGVLCNTSLNFHGKGFINRMSDLLEYVRTTDIDAMVVGDDVYVRASAHPADGE